jgi:hypothetical protein
VRPRGVRIDEQAPYVLALMESPHWPPRVSRELAAMRQAGQQRLLDPAILQSTPEAGSGDYIFPESEQWLMWFVTRGLLIKEGRGTARVRLDGEARFVDDESELGPGEKLLCPPVVGTFHGPSYISHEHLLRPGQKALFEWAAGHQLKAWADKHDHGTPPACSLIVVVFDSTENGTIDRIRIELGVRPLEPVPNRPGHWRLTGQNLAGVTVLPTRREYRSEEAGGSVNHRTGWLHPQRKGGTDESSCRW